MINLSDAAWRKSSRSGPNGACVELTYAGEHAATRDSKNPAGPILVFPTAHWHAFLRDHKPGRTPSGR
ncbi:DUF397 domain-containing protein [Actinophytocola sp.]|uniref:DUF397 domain-containing protein n=1 Tax=Actinophytocola sp. TaxID=1872138 RepID=UPI003D6A8820